VSGCGAHCIGNYKNESTYQKALITLEAKKKKKKVTKKYTLAG
jgi:hypothetical protein